MKIGIYIDGLGQSIARQSVVDYATRLKNELDSHTDGISHELKVEKIKYTAERESNVVSIIESNNGAATVIYKLYDFRYGEILTDGFNKRNILIKNLLLFFAVVSKFPILLKRMFKTTTYNRPFQTFYIFSLFFIIAGAILFMVPATMNVIINFLFGDDVVKFVHEHPWILKVARFFNITHAGLKRFTEVFVSLISLILLLAPRANVIITGLATEFVCAHNYLQFGQQKQDILGNIDRLVEYIAEKEKAAKIHFHSYSYGTLVALDYLFPFGNQPSGNMLNRTEALITIGSPFDFINAYYKNYCEQRNSSIGDKIKWMNVYSVADALGSNFRKDGNAGDAEYGFGKSLPENINYEVVHLNQYSFTNFIFLNSLKVHAMYWSEDTAGQSCLKPIYLKMKEYNLI